MSKTKIMEHVARARASFFRAELIYNSDGNKLEQKASSTKIDVSDMRPAYQMIEEGALITREFYASCESIVMSLDALCRPLLEQNPSAQEVGAIVHLIEEINDTVANTSTDFTIAFEHEQLGDLGSMKPLVSIEAKAIAQYWNSIYQAMPGYKEEEKRILAEKQAAKTKAERIEAELKEEEAKKKEQAKTKLEALEEQREAAYATWLEEVKTIEEKREEELQKELTRYQEQQKNEINAKRDKAIEKLKAEQVDCENRKNQEEQTLGSLGVFRFREKSVCKKTILELSERLEQIPYDIEKCRAKHREESQELKSLLKSKTTSLRKSVNKKLPLPNEPAKPSKIILQELEAAKKDIIAQDEIYMQCMEQVLREIKEGTLSEMRDHCAALSQLSDKRGSVLLDRMYRRGINKNYFSDYTKSAAAIETGCVDDIDPAVKSGFMEKIITVLAGEQQYTFEEILIKAKIDLNNRKKTGLMVDAMRRLVADGVVKKDEDPSGFSYTKYSIIRYW